MALDQGQHAQTNDEAMFFVLLIGIPLLIGLGWHFAGRYLYAWDRIALYGALSLWGSFPTDWPVLGWFTRQFLFFRYTAPKEIAFVSFAVMDALIINGVLMIGIVATVARRVMYINAHHPVAVFGRAMNLYDYVYQQMPLYPHLRVMWKLRLTARPLKDGLFRMGDSGKEFAIRNGLVRLATLDSDPVLDERKAKRVFDMHLGRMLPMPTGDTAKDAAQCIAVLDNNEKAILAAALPRLAVCDPEVSDPEFAAALAKSASLVNQYWVGFDSYNPLPPTDAHHAQNPDSPLVPPPPPVDTRGCDEVLMKYLQFPRVRESLLAHAYIRTFIYDVLPACRRVGKFSPTRFRWLRMLDRRLWLTVNSAGRKEPFFEMAGLHAHYLYERKSKLATEKPQVTEAVVALREEVDSMLFGKKQKLRIWEMQNNVGVVVNNPKDRGRPRQGVAPA